MYVKGSKGNVHEISKIYFLPYYIGIFKKHLLLKFSKYAMNNVACIV